MRSKPAENHFGSPSRLSSGPATPPRLFGVMESRELQLHKLWLETLNDQVFR